MANLTPDEIERRTFTIEERGYDRDEVRKFLFEVAARLRLAFHTTQPPVSFRSQRTAPDPRTEAGDDAASTAASTPGERNPATTTPAAPTSEPTDHDDPATVRLRALPPEGATTGWPGVPTGRARNGDRDRSQDDLSNPLGDPLAALAGTSDFGGTPPTSAKSAKADQAATVSQDAADAVDAIAALDPSDGYQQLGAEVADVLRAAHDAVAARREQSEVIAAAVRAEAEADAVEIRRQAEADAVWQHDRGKRVLITAKEQADAIIAEAEAQAKAMIVSARDQAEQHAQHVAAQARLHAETILRAEREALRRLHEAKSGLTTAIDVIGTAGSRPVVDLTDFRPHVHLGKASVAMPHDEDDPAGQDPLVRMVRHAVHRAVDGAAEHADLDVGDAETDDDTETEADTDGEAGGLERGARSSSSGSLDPTPDAPASV